MKRKQRFSPGPGPGEALFLAQLRPRRKGYIFRFRAAFEEPIEIDSHAFRV